MFKILLTTFALVIAASATAGDIAAGQSKAAVCAGCHGNTGISNNDLWPNLAGQKAGYMKKQLKLFRDGKRNDPMMAGIVKPLTDTDIENLASYYASLK